jgi:phage terminase small subunit
MLKMVILDSNGVAREVLRLNPLLKVAQACEARLAALSDALGLTPKAREKVKQTAVNTKEEIVPGSVADLYPDLLVIPGGKK